MAVKGKQRSETTFPKDLYVGFTSVKVSSISPSLAKRCEMFGVEYDSSKQEPTYLKKDDEGNDRATLTFWLKDEKSGKFYSSNMYITDKVSMSKDGAKVEVINSTCNASYVPFLDGTDEPDTALLLDWIRHFVDKKSGQILGDKKIRKALEGEKKLGEFLQIWLGRLNFRDPETEVMLDTKKLFAGDFSELNELVDSEFDSSFVVLLGVEMDDDGNPQQKVWYEYLPNGFMRYIENGLKFPSDYAQKKWTDFTDRVTGQYGFKGFTELVPIRPYNKEVDIASGEKTKIEEASSDY